MAKSISDNKKPRGRPKTTGTGTLVGIRLHPPMLKALDKFIREDQPGASRPEAIRVLLADALTGLGHLKPSND